MKREEKKSFWSKRNMVSLFIVFIMVSSAIGYMWDREGARREEYNGYAFVIKESQWVTKIDKNEVGFDYFPTEVEDVNVSSEIINRISNTLEIDATYDVNDSYKEGIALAQQRMDEALLLKSLYLRKGMTGENEFELPIITCKNATSSVPVIYFKRSNQTEIILEGNCIIAKARTEADFIRVKDRLLYGMFGIIK